jgi:hypothetical protein
MINLYYLKYYRMPFQFQPLDILKNFKGFSGSAYEDAKQESVVTNNWKIGTRTSIF